MGGDTRLSKAQHLRVVCLALVSSKAAATVAEAAADSKALVATRAGQEVCTVTAINL